MYRPNLNSYTGRNAYLPAPGQQPPIVPHWGPPTPPVGLLGQRPLRQDPIPMPIMGLPRQQPPAVAPQPTPGARAGVTAPNITPQQTSQWRRGFTDPSWYNSQPSSGLPLPDANQRDYFQTPEFQNSWETFWDAAHERGAMGGPMQIGGQTFEPYKGHLNLQDNPRVWHVRPDGTKQLISRKSHPGSLFATDPSLVENWDSTWGQGNYQGVQPGYRGTHRPPPQQASPWQRPPKNTSPGQPPMAVAPQGTPSGGLPGNTRGIVSGSLPSSTGYRSYGNRIPNQAGATSLLQELFGRNNQPQQASNQYGGWTTDMIQEAINRSKTPAKGTAPVNPFASKKPKPQRRVGVPSRAGGYLAELMRGRGRA